MNYGKHVRTPEAHLGLLLPAVNYYHKAFHLGCYSSPRSASEYGFSLTRIFPFSLAFLHILCSVGLLV